MIRNYIKIAWRNLTNRKFYSFLNISGLAIAVSCCILIYLYAGYNLSFDRYHKNADNIFRLVMEMHLDKTEYEKGAPYIEYQTLKTRYPQVSKAAFLIAKQSFIVSVGSDVNKRFKEDNTVSITNSEWFDLFDHQWLQGDANVLNTPGNVVLTQTAARKYFGNADPMGKVLMFDGKPVKVAGILADAPYNTDLKCDIFVSFASLNTLQPSYVTDKYFLTDWGDMGSTYTAFVSLRVPEDKAAVEKQLVQESKDHFGKNAKIFDFRLLPLSEMHFDTRYGGTVQKPLLWNLIIIGILIMAIAVINYINIVVAQQTKRGVEIGTRKVLGGSAGQLFMQFIVESMLNTLIAVAIAVVLVLMLLPAANTWLFADEPVYILSYVNLCFFVAIMLLVITIGTGVYPALLLSRVSISQALKNKVLNMPAGIGRKVLVVFQNTVTQGLIVCTIIIMMQVHYLRNTDIGFDRKSVVTIPVGQLSATQKEQFSQSLRSMPAVQSFSFCNKPPSSNSQRGATFQYNNRVKWEEAPVRFAVGDSAYCKTFGLQLAAGRNIGNSPAKPEFLVNQTMAKILENKHPENVIGKHLSTGDYQGTIVGIVKDFNVKSLVEPIEPTMLLQIADLQTNIAVKLNGDQTGATLAVLQKQYQQILPDQVFSFQFVDQQIADLYKKENIQQKLIWLSAVMAIVISSLGLLGLVSLIALQRTKEIGIRKVLGASITQISMLLSNDFMIMIAIAFAIAAPASYWAMSKWLQGFSHRIDVQWWVFALAGAMAFLIAILTVSFQSIKAAIANPVKSLRSE